MACTRLQATTFTLGLFLAFTLTSANVNHGDVCFKGFMSVHSGRCFYVNYLLSLEKRTHCIRLNDRTLQVNKGAVTYADSWTNRAALVDYMDVVGGLIMHCIHGSGSGNPPIAVTVREPMRTSCSDPDQPCTSRSLQTPTEESAKPELKTLTVRIDDDAFDVPDEDILYDPYANCPNCTYYRKNAEKAYSVVSVLSRSAARFNEAEEELNGMNKVLEEKMEYISDLKSKLEESTRHELELSKKLRDSEDRVDNYKCQAEFARNEAKQAKVFVEKAADNQKKLEQLQKVVNEMASKHEEQSLKLFNMAKLAAVLKKERDQLKEALHAVPATRRARLQSRSSAHSECVPALSSTDSADSDLEMELRRPADPPLHRRRPEAPLDATVHKPPRRSRRRPAALAQATQPSTEPSARTRRSKNVRSMALEKTVHEHIVVDEPVNEHLDKDQVVEETVDDHANECQVVDETVDHHANKDQVVDETVDEDQVVDEPVNEHLVKDQVVDETVDEDLVVDEPVNDHLDKDQVVDETVDEDLVVDEPVNDHLHQYQIADEPVIEQLDRDQVVEEAVNPEPTMRITRSRSRRLTSSSDQSKVDELQQTTLVEPDEPPTDRPLVVDEPSQSSPAEEVDAEAANGPLLIDESVDAEEAELCIDETEPAQPTVKVRRSPRQSEKFANPRPPPKPRRSPAKAARDKRTDSSTSMAPLFVETVPSRMRLIYECSFIATFAHFPLIDQIATETSQRIRDNVAEMEAKKELAQSTTATKPQPKSRLAARLQSLRTRPNPPPESSARKNKTENEKKDETTEKKTRRKTAGGKDTTEKTAEKCVETEGTKTERRPRRTSSQTPSTSSESRARGPKRKRAEPTEEVSPKRTKPTEPKEATSGPPTPTAKVSSLSFVADVLEQVASTNPALRKSHREGLKRLNDTIAANKLAVSSAEMAEQMVLGLRSTNPGDLFAQVRLAPSFDKLGPLITHYEKHFFDFAKQLSEQKEEWRTLLSDFYQKLSLESVRTKASDRTQKCRDYRCMAMTLNMLADDGEAEPDDLTKKRAMFVKLVETLLMQEESDLVVELLTLLHTISPELVMNNIVLEENAHFRQKLLRLHLTNAQPKSQYLISALPSTAATLAKPVNAMLLQSWLQEEFLNVIKINNPVLFKPVCRLSGESNQTALRIAALFSTQHSVQFDRLAFVLDQLKLADSPTTDPPQRLALLATITKLVRTAADQIGDRADRADFVQTVCVKVKQAYAKFRASPGAVDGEELKQLNAVLDDADRNWPKP